jgi:hemoglobin
MRFSLLASCGILLSGLLVSVIGCAENSAGRASAKPAAQSAGQSLYDRLGGKPAITAVVEQFVANVAADQRINGRFSTTDIPRLKGHLVDQVCSATGGPCTTHQGMKITNNDFNALVQDLVAALDKFHVPAKEKNELLALLGPMKKDIVEVP